MAPLPEVGGAPAWSRDTINYIRGSSSCPFWSKGKRSLRPDLSSLMRTDKEVLPLEGPLVAPQSLSISPWPCMMRALPTIKGPFYTRWPNPSHILVAVAAAMVVEVKMGCVFSLDTWSVKQSPGLIPWEIASHLSRVPFIPMIGRNRLRLHCPLHHNDYICPNYAILLSWLVTLPSNILPRPKRKSAR